jgi:hypothetical protein
MKRALVTLIAGTVLCGLAAAYAATGKPLETKAEIAAAR